MYIIVFLAIVLSPFYLTFYVSGKHSKHTFVNSSQLPASTSFYSSNKYVNLLVNSFYVCLHSVSTVIQSTLMRDPQTVVLHSREPCLSVPRTAFLVITVKTLNLT